MSQRGTAAEAQRGTEPPPSPGDRRRPVVDRASTGAEPHLVDDAAVAELTGAQRYDLIDLWVMLLDELYVHLPQKRSLYGYDPIRALEALRRDEALLDDDAFHRELMLTINRLRDAHTQYRPPGRVPGHVARLPFLVEAIGPAARPQFVVSKVARELVEDSEFEPGVEILTWNAVPIERVIDHHADTEVGGRPDARRARALDSLTFRSLEHRPPPEERHVVLEYVTLGREQRSIRFEWRWIVPERAPGTDRGSPRARQAIDTRAEIVRRAKKLMFNSALWEAEREPATAPVARRRRKRAFGEPIDTPLQDLVTARRSGRRANRTVTSGCGASTSTERTRTSSRCGDC